MTVGHSFRPCVLIPIYDNPATIAQVVQDVRAHARDIIVVDDGSAEPTRRVLEGLRDAGLAQVIRREPNAGKGAAVKAGFAEALAQGYSHALQLDADGQHCSDDIPRFLAAAQANPTALVLGAPQFGADAPKARLYGRLISIWFVHLETAGRIIADPLCGFRVYPLATAGLCAPRANRMQFDPEIAVRMVWRGVPVLNLPTRVTYASRKAGGVSHFQLVRDNLRISVMHSRLMCRMIFRRLFRALAWAWPALDKRRAELPPPAAERRERRRWPAA